MISGSYFVFDFETTNRRKGSPFDSANQPVCLAWVYRRYAHPGLGVRRVGYKHFHADWLFEEEDVSSLAVDLHGRDVLMVGHNVKFDLHWWDRLGYPRGDKIWDTMFPPYVAKPSAAKGLSDLVQDGKLESGSIWVHDLGQNPLDMDPRECVRYCLQDVLATERLFLSQYDRFGGPDDRALEAP